MTLDSVPAGLPAVPVPAAEHGSAPEAGDMAADGRRAGYCPAHAEACEKWGRDFGPFPGCPNCPRPALFDLKTQPHLLAAAGGEA